MAFGAVGASPAPQLELQSGAISPDPYEDGVMTELAGTIGPRSIGSEWHCLTGLAGEYGAINDALRGRLPASYAYAINQLGPIADKTGTFRLNIVYWSVGPAGRRWLTQTEAIVDGKTCNVMVDTLDGTVGPTG